MHTYTVRLFLLLCIVLSVAGPTQPGLAQHQQERFFPQTGHWLRGRFLEAWETTPDALYILGAPISAPFIEESFTTPGQYYRVQYLERAIFEEHLEYADTALNDFAVQIRMSGTMLAQDRTDEQPFQPILNPGDGTWMASTQHTLRDYPAPFRSFVERYGGVHVFGYPISEQFEEIDSATSQLRVVQYFERQRLTWYPNLAHTRYQVVPAPVGKLVRGIWHHGNTAFANSESGETPRPFIYGYNAMLYHDMAPWQDRSRVLELTKASGITWIRQQITWKDLHKEDGEISWGELDQIVEDAHAAGIHLLITVIQAPWWATPNGHNGLPRREHFGTFAHFMGQMAARYRGKVQAYEIWNEQNLACQNGGDCSSAGGIGGRVISADFYVDMLYEAYNAIKANDPGAIVVSGATASTETNDPDYAISDTRFMQQMLTNPRFRADVIGVHPGDRNNPPDTLWPENPGPGPGWQTSREFYFRRIEDMRAIAVQCGKGDMQFWITEFGWATPNITPGFEYGNANSFEDQSQWIVRAFDKGRYDYAPWVGAMFVWNLNFAISWKGAHNNPLHEQASYGILNPDWSPRPAWYAIQEMPKQ